MAVVFAELAFDRLAFGWVIGDLVLALPLFFSLSLSLFPSLPPPLSCGYYSAAPSHWLCEGVMEGWMDGGRKEGQTGTEVEGY